MWICFQFNPRCSIWGCFWLHTAIMIVLCPSRGAVLPVEDCLILGTLERSWMREPWEGCRWLLLPLLLPLLLLVVPAAAFAIASSLFSGLLGILRTEIQLAPRNWSLWLAGSSPKRSTPPLPSNLLFACLVFEGWKRLGWRRVVGIRTQ